MSMILFGDLSAATKTYLLCRSDRHAFTSAFCNTLPVGYLKFCVSLEIPSSIWPLTISFQDDRTETLPFLFSPMKCILTNSFTQKLIIFLSQSTLQCISGLLQSDLSTWNLDDRKVTSDYV